MNLPSTNSDSDNNSEHNNNERPPATIIPFVEASDSGPSFTFDRRSCWVLGGLPYPGLGVVGWEVYGCPGWPTVSRPQVPTPACYSCHIPPLAEWPSLPLTDDIPHIRDIMIRPSVARWTTAAFLCSRPIPPLAEWILARPYCFPPYQATT